MFIINDEEMFDFYMDISTPINNEDINDINMSSPIAIEIL